MQTTEPNVYHCDSCGGSYTVVDGERVYPDASTAAEVARLREMLAHEASRLCALDVRHEHAKDEIARLTAERNQLAERCARLEALLRPFAREAEEWHESADDSFAPFIGDYNPDGALLPAEFTVGDMRAARSALAPTEQEEEGR